MDLLPNVFVEFDEVHEEVSAEAHEVKEAQDQEAPAEAPLQKAHEDIFEPAPKVPKKKREATEKQKAHLKIIREKALARKREIQEEKRLEKAVKAHEDEEKRLKKNHYTRAEVDALVITRTEVDALVITRTEVDALVNQRFTEYEDKHKQQEHNMLQQQQHMLLHRKKKSSWDTWI